MTQNSRLRIGLTILNTACLFLLSSAFVSKTGLTKAPTFRIADQTDRYYSPPALFSSSTDEQSAAAADVVTTDNTIAAPIPTEWQGEVLQTLKSVVDPDLNQDIVTLGFVQNLQLDQETRTVKFDVELTTPACPVKETFRTDCKTLVEALPFVSVAEVTMTAQAPSNTETDTSGMAGIGAIIAVSSCKGGVGKSTTSVNLAYSLQAMGASVGIFDADVYGPSLPTMVQPDDDIVRFVGRQIAPLQRNGVRLMSFGYINDGSAVMRGPMVSQLLDQFLSVTDWGSLDYLILDMPPGTGDIQLTLTQRLNITAAVIVTTPQELSFADVVRGVEMFDTVNVPCIAVVENMAYYDNDPAKAVNNADELGRDVLAKLQEQGLLNNGDGDEIANELVQLVLQNAKTEPIRIFGPGHKQRLSSQWGIEHTYSMPLMDQIAANGDSGTPFVLGNPESKQTQIYRELAKSVVSEVAKTKYQNSARPEIEYIEELNLLQVDEEPLEPAELRRACRCAMCVEELTGRQILKPSDVPDSIKPLKMSSTGNYALSVDWSDGHRSLYPYRQIKKLVYGDDWEEAEKGGKTSPESSSPPTPTKEQLATAEPVASAAGVKKEETTCECCP